MHEVLAPWHGAWAERLKPNHSRQLTPVKNAHTDSVNSILVDREACQRATELTVKARASAKDDRLVVKVVRVHLEAEGAQRRNRRVLHSVVVPVVAIQTVRAVGDSDTIHVVDQRRVRDRRHVVNYYYYYYYYYHYYYHYYDCYYYYHYY